MNEDMLGALAESLEQGIVENQVHKWLLQMDARTCLGLSHGLQLLTASGSVLSIGQVNCGAPGLMENAPTIARLLHAQLGFMVNMEPVFVAEFDEKAKAFHADVMRSTLDSTALFFENPHCLDQVTGTLMTSSFLKTKRGSAVVPYSNVFISVLEDEGRTIGNAALSIAYIQRTHPHMVILDAHVALMTAHSNDPDILDSDELGAKLEDAGYGVIASVVDAKKLGAPTHYNRLFICGIRGKQSNSTFLAKTLQYMFSDRVVGELIDPRDKWRYDDDHSSCDCCRTSNVEPLAQSAQDKHAEEFSKAKLQWPPDFSMSSASLTQLLTEPRLTTKMRELLFFLEKTEPLSMDASVWQYLDLNVSISALASSTSIPSDQVPVITSKSVILARRQCHSDIEYRLLSGGDPLRMVGMSDSVYRQEHLDQPCSPCQLNGWLTHVAARTQNVYCIYAVLLALITYESSENIPPPMPDANDDMDEDSNDGAAASVTSSDDASMASVLGSD